MRNATKIVEGESCLNLSPNKFRKQLESDGYTVIDVWIEPKEGWYHPPVIARVEIKPN